VPRQRPEVEARSRQARTGAAKAVERVASKVAAKEVKVLSGK